MVMRVPSGPTLPTLKPVAGGAADRKRQSRSGDGRDAADDDGAAQELDASGVTPRSTNAVGRLAPKSARAAQVGVLRDFSHPAFSTGGRPFPRCGKDEAFGEDKAKPGKRILIRG